MVTITQYLYKQEDIVLEFSVDLVTGDRTPRRFYLYGSGIDDPVAYYECPDAACSRGNPWRVYAKDHWNSVEAVYLENRTVAETFSYSSFGVPATSPSSSHPYACTAPEFAHAGLYYYRACYYNPHIGRFISPDPFEGRIAGIR